MFSLLAKPLRTLARTTTVRAACLLLPALLCLTQIGCQSGTQQAHRDLYHRELRLQEDEIYRLEDCIEEYQSLIRGYRVEIDQLKTKLHSAPSGAVDSSTDFEPIAPGDDLLNNPGARSSEMDPPSRDPNEDVPDIEVPSINLGEPTEPPLEPPVEPPAERSALPAIDIPSSPTESPAEPPSRYGSPGVLPLPEPPAGAAVQPLGDAPAWEMQPPATAESEPDTIMSLSVAGYAGPTIEGGESTLVALIRPLGPSGAPATFRGEASLMLIDPDDSARGKKLARWDFTPEEVAQSWRKDTPTPVLDLAIVLPKSAPRDRNLQLWVRLKDQHGLKTLERADITVNKLAGIEKAKLASQSPQPGAPSGTWRPADRVATHQPAQAPANNGWTKSDAPRSRVQQASHQEPAERAQAPGDWSPKR